MCRISSNITIVMEEAGTQEEGIMDRVGAIHMVDKDICMMYRVMDICVMDRVGAIHMVDRDICMMDKVMDICVMDRVGAIHIVNRVMDIGVIDKVMVVHMALVEEDKISGIGTSSMDTKRRIVEVDILILQC